MMVKLIAQFMAAFETHKHMMKYEFRETSAVKLADAFANLPVTLINSIAYDEKAFAAMHSVAAVVESLPHGAARELVAKALDPLRIAYADSIVRLNIEPEPAVMATDGAANA